MAEAQIPCTYTLKDTKKESNWSYEDGALHGRVVHARVVHAVLSGEPLELCVTTLGRLAPRPRLAACAAARHTEPPGGSGAGSLAQATPRIYSLCASALRRAVAIK